MSAAEELKRGMLREPRWTLAVAESLTAGNLQAAVTSVSGASGFFLGGVTAYSLEQKVRLLGVERGLAEATNCVAREVAEQMARGVCELFGAEVGAATTGYAEASAEAGVAVPFAWWAVAWKNGGNFVMRSGREECAGATRVEVQRRVAAAVLAELGRAVGEWRK
jgi:competence/damage-inducible protein CinA C-terminal domain